MSRKLEPSVSLGDLIEKVKRYFIKLHIGYRRLLMVLVPLSSIISFTYLYRNEGSVSDKDLFWFLIISLGVGCLVLILILLSKWIIDGFKR